MADIGVLNQKAGEVYRYMNFNEIADYQELADTVKV